MGHLIRFPCSWDQRDRKKPRSCKNYSITFVKSLNLIPAPSNETAQVAEVRRKAPQNGHRRMKLGRNDGHWDMVNEPLERRSDECCAFRCFELFVIEDIKHWGR